MPIGSANATAINDLFSKLGITKKYDGNTTINTIEIEIGKITGVNKGKAAELREFENRVYSDTELAPIREFMKSFSNEVKDIPFTEEQKAEALRYLNDLKFPIQGDEIPSTPAILKQKIKRKVEQQKKFETPKKVGGK